MRPKTLLLLAVAILCGLTAAFTVSQIRGPGSDDLVHVLVPKADIPSGIRLDVKSMFVTKPFPRPLVPINVISDPAKLDGKVASRTLTANLPVTERDLFHSSGVIANLEPGYRAMTIRASIESAMHGMLMPGSRVDIVTVVRDSQDAKRNESRIFLQNIKVLAINALADQPEGKSAIPNPASITLMVRPDQVERLYLVSNRNQVGMVLRKPGDTERVPTLGAKDPFEGDKEPANGAALVQAFVARGPLEPGRVIDRFDECFQMMSFQPTQLIDQPIVDRGDIEGKRLTRFIAKGQPAMRVNFLPLGVADKSDPDHVMTVHNGPHAEVYKFQAKPTPAPALPKPASPDDARHENGD